MPKQRLSTKSSNQIVKCYIYVNKAPQTKLLSVVLVKISSMKKV